MSDRKRTAGAGLAASLVAGLLMFGAGAATSASAATPPTLDVNVLLIGSGSTDPTTAAWQAALSNQGVAYTMVTTSGATYGSETVTLPALSTGTTGYFNGVVIADSPAALAAGQLTALDAYESTFRVRQIDGYTYPDLGETDPTGTSEVLDPADGTTATLTAAGLAALPELAGPIPYATDTYGSPSTATAGAPFTSWLADASGNVLAGVYQHPSTDAQAGVAELELNFDYSATDLPWLLLAPGLINWVTADTHLGLDRNYAEMDIDDTFTPDNAWSTTTHDNDYSDASSQRMDAADAVISADWSNPTQEKDTAARPSGESATPFRLDELFNYGGSIEYQNGELDLPGEPAACATAANAAGTCGADPLLAQFQATDPNTGQPYSADFGWISHTYDTPYLDVGCATQNYIEAELNENTADVTAAHGATAGTGGLGLTESTVAAGATDVANPYGTYNPQVFVPGNHSGFADLDPGTPATVDPPDLDAATAATTGGLAAGTYEYAVTDQFNAADSPTTDQSQAYVTAPITVTGTTGSVSLVWQSICHAANYIVYRAAGPSYTTWTEIGTYATPASATLPDNSSADSNPASTATVCQGPSFDATSCAGEQELTFADTGATAGPGPSAGITYLNTPTAAGWTPPVVENADELPWEQNPYFTAALTAAGITTVGADASKAYPNPPDNAFGIGVAYPTTGATYAAGQPFVDGTSEVAPRHPINVFYNVATNAQELDEYNTLYSSAAPNSQCQDTAVTTCSATLYTFPQVINSVVSGMFTNVLSNNPEISYVHQTNTMGKPPYSTVLPAANYVPAATAAAGTDGDGTLYEVLNPLIAEYDSYFNTNTPYQQLTMGGIGVTLAEQTAWSAAQAASTPTVTTSETNGVVTIHNSGGAAVKVPVTVPVGTTTGSPAVAFGQAYEGQMSAWVSVPAGGSYTLTEKIAPAITSAATANFIVGTTNTFTVSTTGYPEPALTYTGALPAGVTFTDNGDGTATITGTPAAGTGAAYPLIITATSTAGTTTQSFSLSASGAPTITSATTATFTTTVAGSYNVTTTGYPAPTITETGTLPTGVTFTAGTGGTATIAGTPAAGSAGSYPVSISASNVSGSTATLTLTITVNTAAPPAFTSLSAAYFTTGQPGSFGVAATGEPAPAFTEEGALPAGITWADQANGALLAGTSSASGTYLLSITAANGQSPNAVQDFSLVVGQTPAITSAATASGTVGKAFTFPVTTSGVPSAVMTESGTLPDGLEFVDNGNGTATISGTPTTVGSAKLALTAANAYGAPTSTLTITVGPPTVSTIPVSTIPAFTTTTAASGVVGSPFSFAVTTTGVPAPTLTATGLPAGLAFQDNLNGTGTISGTPTAIGTGTVHLTATSTSGTATQTLSITVGPPNCPPAAAVGAVGAAKGISAVEVGPCPGYWIATAAGDVVPFGAAPSYGSMLGTTLNSPIVDMVTTNDNKGYYLLGADGGIFSFGDARFFGSTGGIHLNQPVVGMAVTPDGGGYWLVAADGGIFSFGDARFFGSTGGIHLNQPVVGMAVTPDGGGYWLAASDGGVFTFGDAHYQGSMGGTALNKPIVGITTDPLGQGYRMVASDGGIFSFGAPFYGSLGASPPAAPVTAMAPSATGNGYYMLGSAGAVYAFGDAPYLGGA